MTDLQRGGLSGDGCVLFCNGGGGVSPERIQPFSATVATGNPLGICTVASRASRPSMAPPFIGMPTTGSVVLAAKAPARWAAIPAAHRMTPYPLARADFAKAAAASGVRWAERMWASYGTPNSFSTVQADLTTGQSLSEPMMIATFFMRLVTSLTKQNSAVACQGTLRCGHNVKRV